MAGNGGGLRALSNYQVNRPGMVEKVRQRLYDSNIYNTAGQTQLFFFQTQKGAGVTSAVGATAGGVKNINDTNMELAGQLPAYKNYMLESIEVHFIPGTNTTANQFTAAQAPGRFIASPATAFQPASNDSGVFYNSGSLSFFIGSKEYLREAPLAAFPPKAKLGLQAAIGFNGATTGATLFDWPMANGRPYFVQPQITIPSNQNFYVLLEWPGAVTTPSGFNARVMVVLDGYLYRNSQ
jgi:hypothetical protein